MLTPGGGWGCVYVTLLCSYVPVLVTIGYVYIYTYISRGVQGKDGLESSLFLFYIFIDIIIK